jgi:hypothetical protein
MKRIFAVLATSLLMTSCATIFTGTKQTLQVNSVPPGADVEVDGINRGVTPLPVSIKKGFEGPTITLKKEGFETKKFQPETSFNPVSVLNLFGLLGWAVDAATGAMMKYNPKVYEIKLEKKAQ